MILAGLTGSIGMGKSVAADMLRGMGIPVHCSDEAVHDLLGPGGAAVEKVARAFPDAYDRKNDGIDRKALGAIVFSDEKKRQSLEAILHPLVVGSQYEFIAVNMRQRRPLIVLDIPLLFETGADARLDFTIVVSAPFFIQKRRVLSRPGMTEEKFAAILSRQMPDREKRKYADFVVETGLGRAHTRRQLRSIMSKLQKTGSK